MPARFRLAGVCRPVSSGWSDRYCRLTFQSGGVVGMPDAGLTAVMTGTAIVPENTARVLTVGPIGVGLPPVSAVGGGIAPQRQEPERGGVLVDRRIDRVVSRD